MDKFENPLYVGRPNIGSKNAFLHRVERILDTRWLSNDGPLVKEFENRIAQLLGVKHAIAMCNATVAIELLARAIGLQGEVIVPSYTFVATAHALQWQGITPVFCDIDPDTHLINPKKIESLITPRTTGIMGVHLWGRACNVEDLQGIADRHSLQLVFDASHAFGCSSNGVMIGAFGRAEVFSFHATKFINSFEGGAVTTNDDELAKQLVMMKNFGFIGYDDVRYLGVNGKMSEISAAMGLTNLDALDDIVRANRQNYEAYKAGLADIEGLGVIEYSECERSNFQYVVIEVDSGRLGVDRDTIVAELHKRNVIARKYFWPGCHRMEPYKSLYPNSHLWLQETEQLAEKVIILPTGETVTVEMVEAICRMIEEILAYCKHS